MESSELYFGRLNEEFCGKPSITFLVLKEGYMLTHYRFQTVNSCSFHYGPSLLQPFCLHLLLSAPFLPLTKHPALTPQACKCLWHRGWRGGSLPVNVWLMEWKPIRLLALSFQWTLFHPCSFTCVGSQATV